MSGYEIVTASVIHTTTGADTLGPFTATCPVGKMVVGGGGSAVPPPATILIPVFSTVPVGGGTGWSVEFLNFFSAIGLDVEITVYAICVVP